MTTKLETLEAAVRNALGDDLQSLTVAVGEVTIVVKASNYLSAMRVLRDHADTRFEELIDLCGVDYSTYGDGTWDGPRFAVVSHLLSIKHNWRVRVRTFCPDDEMPLVPSITGIWRSANWYEREAFDLYGILFDGHG